MIQSNISETSPITSDHENNVKNESEARILTKKDLDEQIRNFFKLDSADSGNVAC